MKHIVMETEAKCERVFDNEIILEDLIPKLNETDRHQSIRNSAGNEYQKIAIGFRNAHLKQAHIAAIIMYVVGTVMVFSVIYCLIFLSFSKNGQWYLSAMRIVGSASLLGVMRFFYKIRENHFGAATALEDKILKNLKVK